MAKASSSIDLSALKSASNYATGYITDIGNDGIRIHDANTTNNSIVINSNGMEIFKGGLDSSHSVAKYGDTARIGKTSSGNIVTTTDGITINEGSMEILSIKAYSDEDTGDTYAKINSNASMPLNIAADMDVTIRSFNEEVTLATTWASVTCEPMDDNDYPNCVVLRGTKVVATGALHAENSLTIGGHSSSVGSQVNGTKVDTSSTAIPDSINVAVSTGTSIAQLVLPAGVWIVYGQARFASNSTGYRRMGFSATKNNASLDITVGASSSGATQISNTRVLSPSSQTTYYLNVTHNGSTTLAISDIVFAAWRLV